MDVKHVLWLKTIVILKHMRDIGSGVRGKPSTYPFSGCFKNIKLKKGRKYVKY
jgi:hypothetical protein